MLSIIDSPSWFNSAVLADLLFVLFAATLPSLWLGYALATKPAGSSARDYVIAAVGVQAVLIWFAVAHLR